MFSLGYDPEMFPQTMGGPRNNRSAAGPVRLLHSGIVYPYERNPSQLFVAIAELRMANRLGSEDLRVVFRASGEEQRYQAMVAQHDIEDMVEFLPKVPYQDALREMLDADACLLLQSRTCNQQIPAKLYEYFYCQKPILALVDPAGDSARQLLDVGFSDIAPLEDSQAIVAALPAFVDKVRQGSAFTPDEETVTRFSRRRLAQVLASQLDRLI